MTDASGIYAYADVGRQGLGHGLFAWAHALIWARRYDAELLPPIWLRPRIGPWLRRERDKRTYFLQFQGAGPGVALRRLRLLAMRKRVIATLDGKGGTPPRKDGLHVFQMGQALDTEAIFRPMIGHHHAVGEALRAMARPHLLPRPASEPFIAIHIRQGDFQAANTDALSKGVKNTATPVHWFADTLSAVRSALGEAAPARIFSDAPPAGLAAIMTMPNVECAPRAPAIHDMLAIADADLLIGSGSNFSLWGSYLSQIPRISHPGQTIASVLQDPARELEYDPAGGPIRLPAGFNWPGTVTGRDRP